MSDPDDDPISDAALAALRAAPGFRDALHDWATGVLAFHAGAEPHLSKIFRDKNTMTMGVTVLILHDLNALTAPAIKAGCKTAGASSPGRIDKFIADLRRHGDLVMKRDAAGVLQRNLVPSERLIAHIRDIYAIFCRVAAKHDPRVVPLLTLLDDVPYCVIQRWSIYYMLMRPDRHGLRHDDPAARLFYMRAGHGLLAELIIAQRTSAEPFSISALARRLGVSRAQIHLLLAEAEAAGLLIPRGNESAPVVTAQFWEIAEYDLATKLLLVHPTLSSAATGPAPTTIPPVRN